MNDAFQEMMMRRELEAQQAQQSSMANLPASGSSWALLNPMLARMMGMQANAFTGAGIAPVSQIQQQRQQQIQQQLQQRMQQQAMMAPMAASQGNMLFNNALGMQAGRAMGPQQAQFAPQNVMTRGFGG